MGRLAKVLRSFIEKIPSINFNGQRGSVEEFAGDSRSVWYYGPCNEDFSPPIDTQIIDFNIGRDRGFIVGAAYTNVKIPPIALPGERRLYATNEDGDTVQCEIFLKRDKTIFISNGPASVTVSPDGTITTDTLGQTICNANKSVFNNNVDIHGDLTIINTSGTSVLGSDGIDINGTNFTHNGTNVGDNHPHSGVTTGSGNSGPPV